MKLKNNGLSASLEDYLEVIYNILQDSAVARITDIANRLNVKKSSVSAAMRALSTKGLINHSSYGYITLSDKGREIAQNIVKRHRAIKRFFTIVLNASDRVADETACKVEHIIPECINERLIRFVEFIEQCPRSDSLWLERLYNYYENKTLKRDCESCIKGVRI